MKENTDKDIPLAHGQTWERERMSQLRLMPLPAVSSVHAKVTEAEEAKERAKIVIAVEPRRAERHCRARSGPGGL